MKNFIVAIFIAFLLASCQGSVNKDGVSKSVEDKMVEYTRQHTKEDVELISWESVKGQLPRLGNKMIVYYGKRVSEDKKEFQEGSRGLWGYYDAHKGDSLWLKERVGEHQAEIQEQLKKMEDNQSDKEFYMLLGTFKHDDGTEVRYGKSIVVFDPETLEAKSRWIKIGEDESKEAAVIEAVKNGCLYEFALNPDLTAIADTTQSTLLRYILLPVTAPSE